MPHNTVLMLSNSDIMVGNDVGVYRSFDGGVSWLPWMDDLPLGAVVTDLKYSIAQSIVTAGTYGNGAWQTTLGQVSPILLYESSSAPVEIDGNGNSLIEPGETWGVQISLRNGGGATAVAPQGTLTTSTSGVTMVNGGVVDFVDILPGLVGNSVQLVTFILDPDTICGDTLIFDLVNLTTANDSGPFGDVPNAFSVSIGGFLPPISFTLIDDDFDPSPGPEWSHELIDPAQPGCTTLPPYTDEWQVLSKDAAHGDSYHAGRGPGLTYLRKNHGWLYYAGKDSAGDAGVTIPADAISATLTFDHWYETAEDRDGGLVAIDFLQDGTDNYTVINPVDGYPAGSLAFGNCNGLEGFQAYHGNSGGWTTATFDLFPYKGNTVYIAFVFGSDSLPTVDEGWYIDNIFFEYEENGASVCEPLNWPGIVPQDVLFGINGPGTVEATWGDSCNIGIVPGQQYSIHAGDLSLLRTTGTYNHAPVDGLCDKTSPATFSYGPGLQYFLVLPNDGAREGGAGTDSLGNPRPAPFNVCGEQRIGTCS